MLAPYNTIEQHHAIIFKWTSIIAEQGWMESSGGINSAFKLKQKSF